jgi:curved DNA-binding protein
MEYKDYYKVLGVARDADQDAVKRSYRRLARKYHPDVSKEPDAKERFQEVGEAYEVLKDPEKRAAYDQIGSQWKPGQDFTPPPGWDAGFEFGGGGFTGASEFSDFFEALFGQAAGAKTQTHQRREFHMQGEDHHAKVMVALEDAFAGATRSISLAVPQYDDAGHITTKTRTLNVKIPKGVTEGQRIRLQGQGGVGFGRGEPGDLYLEVAFEPHALFRADRRDIYVDLPVTPWEAALGETIVVPTLGGEVELKVPRDSQTGKTLRLKGRGLPGNPAGDQYVILQIVAPRADTPEGEALYRKMAVEMPMNPRAAMRVSA